MVSHPGNLNGLKGALGRDVGRDVVYLLNEPNYKLPTLSTLILQTQGAACLRENEEKINQQGKAGPVN